MSTSAQGYAVVLPLPLLEDERVTLTALRVYALLMDKAERSGWCRVGQEVLGRELGLGNTAVSKALALLSDCGFLAIKRTGRTSMYRAKFYADEMADTAAKADSTVRQDSLLTCLPGKSDLPAGQDDKGLKIFPLPSGEVAGEQPPAEAKPRKPHPRQPLVDALIAGFSLETGPELKTAYVVANQLPAAATPEDIRRRLAAARRLGWDGLSVHGLVAAWGRLGQQAQRAVAGERSMWS